MATISGSVVGNVTVGTPANKEVNVAIDPVTQTFNNHTGKGRLTTTGASASYVDIPQGVISNIAMAWLNSVQAADESIPENLKNVRITIGGSPITFPAIGTLLHICNPKSESNMTKIEVLPNDPDSLVTEHLLAGDA